MQSDAIAFRVLEAREEADDELSREHRVAFAFACGSAKPNWMPNAPMQMLQTCHAVRCGFVECMWSTR